MLINHHSQQEQLNRVSMIVLEEERASFRVVMMEQNFVTAVVAQNVFQVLQV